jgi:pimeloyl-ACP methyl ester carboxylesterase
MGHVDAAPPPTAVELTLPSGSVVRGLRWGSGPDVALLLHEPGADLDAWGALPPRLARALGLRAIAVDLPGHGLSDAPWREAMTDSLAPAVFAAFVPEILIPPWRPDRREASPGGSAAEPHIQPSGRRFLVAAGACASATLAAASHDVPLAGIVALSPARISFSASDTGADEGAPTDRRAAIKRGTALVPKLIIAGSLAGDDLKIARQFASGGAGWTVVTTLPVTERGTSLLATPWRSRVEEQVIDFLRDCHRARPGIRSGPRLIPRIPG